MGYSQSAPFFFIVSERVLLIYYQCIIRKKEDIIMMTCQHISEIWTLYREWQMAMLDGLAAIGAAKLNSIESELAKHINGDDELSSFCRDFKDTVLPLCRMESKFH